MIGVIALAQSLLYCAILFLVGRILNNPAQLRRFLGLTKDGEDPSQFANISLWVEKIGLLVQIIACVGGLVAVFATLQIF